LNISWGNIAKKISEIVGEENITTSLVDLITYSSDASIDSGMPNLVVWPTTPEQISKIVKLANEYHFPIIPRGAGTGLSGGAVPKYGGVILDLSRMNKILEISTQDLQVLVEAGVVADDLNQELAKHGLFFPPDPASSSAATIGGMLAENAGGIRAVKYGTTREWVLGLEVVLPTGEVLWVGRRAMKWVAGYDLVRLFIGSEGTLGIITKALLKVRPLPETALSAFAMFSSLEQAVHCVYKIIIEGLEPSKVEFLDQITLDAISKYTGTSFPPGEAAIIIELDGEKLSVEKRLERLIEIFKEEKALSYDVARTPEENMRIWQARKAALPALSSVKPTVVIEDVTVPISKLPYMVKVVQEISKKFNIPVATFGHVGDGNFHPCILLDIRNRDEVERMEKCALEIAKAAIKVGGTVSGEHGIGTLKMNMYRHEAPTELVKLLLKIKRALDPNNIMNPGKIFPKEYLEGNA
jgi:glycolate oxidase